MNTIIHVAIIVSVVFMVLIGILLFIFKDDKNEKIPKMIERILFVDIVLFVILIVLGNIQFMFNS
jgi:predicted membrane protein